MKKIIAISLALVLSGCATDFGTRITETISAVSNFSVTQSQLDTVRSSYDGTVLAPLRRYAMLPYCKKGQTISISVPCHDRGLLAQLRLADKSVGIAFTDTQSKIDSGDNKGAVIAYNLLTAAIDTAKALIAKSGVEVL